MSEEWRAIEGFEGYYSVSDKGHVFSHRSKKVLKPVPQGKKQYQAVTLYHPERKPNLFLVHRLVAAAFLDNPNGYPWVLHWDDDGTNNEVTNLRWGTPSDNVDDALRNGGRYKTSCIRGHPFDEENTRFDGRGRKTCRICALNHQRWSRNSKLAKPWEELSVSN